MASGSITGNHTINMHPSLEARLAELRENEARNARRREQILKERRFLIPIFLFVLVLFPNFGTIGVVGPSMKPTFETGDRLLMLKTFRVFSPLKPGDVILIKKKDGSLAGEDLIKRVVCVKDGQGKITWMPTVMTADGEYIPRKLFTEFALGLRPFPNNSVLVLGDNINHSTDSRDPEVGAVRDSEIEGKVLLR